MTTFYSVSADDKNIADAAEHMAAEYEVPMAVMEEALRDYFTEQADELLDNLRERADRADDFQRIVDRKLAVHNRMKQYEKADQ